MDDRNVCEDGGLPITRDIDKAFGSNQVDVTPTSLEDNKERLCKKISDQPSYDQASSSAETVDYIKSTTCDFLSGRDNNCDELNDLLSALMRIDQPALIQQINESFDVTNLRKSEETIKEIVKKFSKTFYKQEDCPKRSLKVLEVNATLQLQCQTYKLSKPMTTECVFSSPNCGKALAYGYFSVLKEALFEAKNNTIMTRLRNFEIVNNVKMATKQLLIAVPKCGNYQITQNDNFKYKNNLDPVVYHVDGIENREYVFVVCEVTEQNQETAESRFFAIDIPHCLHWLHKLKSQGKINGNDVNDICEQFIEVLSALLASEDLYRRKYAILPYSENENLTDVILNYRKTPPKHQLEFPLKVDYVGIDLAYQYYHNYLCVVLPHFLPGIKEWERTVNFRRKVIPKLFILVPNSCAVVDNFEDLINDDEDEDREGLEYITGGLQPVVIPDCLIQTRTYERNLIKVWKVKENNGKMEKKQLYCSAQFATPVRTLYRMSRDDRISLDKKQMIEERKRFTETLKELVRTNKEHRKLCEIVVFNDENDFIFSKALFQKIARKNKR